MSKKNKKSKIKKTQVEQILDKNNIPYEQAEFPTHQGGDVRSMSVDHTGIDEHVIYKTLVLTGNVTGPLVGVIPVDTHLDEKKLAKVSGNKKVNMVPLKNLLKTTGYVHGANTPVGIYEKFQYPIFIDTEAKEQGEIYVSSGKVGRSVKLNAEDLAGLVHATFADLEQK
ncbi:Cys-tRNA(Pro) deacylase [Lactobacillus reuteri]|uniref:Cys-tRNA(Pro) deacylase n=1 Tax=Limosilactobacillus reuteri TaxID=1598 RepID=UPI00146B49FE|nr:Cys-tRNA(Pro) deacylase [Limosilactobacillus reuteri]NMV49613.1 Cys-tRNA(Pro) deacylase [Limosilactobacillus reuteri]NMV51277.1 Cys-tRNA(Pro) deacylase [Limosilactobacillus reuteri]NMV60237.1 Cys-tRNA(Pro) deacylase [Limosilactobacillus reuteri]NMV62051.1 Cys-tRNA(Pro) deacylase [Limosilactobacillus reuteri]NMV63814.1 Cys-tRNA(Pro) deacylase [Limosilactobacillus reuteri]